MTVGEAVPSGQPRCCRVTGSPLGIALSWKPQALQQGGTDRKPTRRRALPESPSFSPLVHESVTTAKQQHLVTLLPTQAWARTQRQGAEGSHRRTLWAPAMHSSNDHRVATEHRVAWRRVWFRILWPLEAVSAKYEAPTRSCQLVAVLLS